jgi:hypothetical protein
VDELGSQYARIVSRSIAKVRVLPSETSGQRRRPEVNAFSQLNSPACTCPCQRFAAALAGRPTHDSGSERLATPSSCDFFLHDISPVCAGAPALAYVGVRNVPVHSTVNRENAGAALTDSTDLPGFDTATGSRSHGVTRLVGSPQYVEEHLQDDLVRRRRAPRSQITKQGRSGGPFPAAPEQSRNAETWNQRTPLLDDRARQESKAFQSFQLKHDCALPLIEKRLDGL